MLGLINSRLRAARDTADQGVALLVVIGIGVVMMALVATGLSVATSGLRAASTDQDSTGALNAAYAGVQDYLTHLGVDSTYPQYGNPASTFNTGNALTLPTGSSTNPAFGMGTSGTWATVPGSSTSSFRYEVDASKFLTNGIVRLRSTGRVGQTTRTLVANVKQVGFTNYVYFTNFEMADPALTGFGGTTPSSNPDCAIYGWAGRDNTTCFGGAFRLPRFGTGVLTGAVHSNDTIAMTSCATFNGTVTTGDPGGNPSYNGGKNYDDNGPCGPQTSDGTPVTFTSVPVIAMPATNASMQNETRSDLSTNPGCLYTGPTTIVFNSDGTMTVTSPWTKYTNTAASAGSTTPNTGSNPLKCGTPGTSTGQLGSPGGATVNQLSANLLYVQTVPLISTDPNYTSTSVTPAGVTCLGADGSSTVQGSAASAGWKFGSTRFPLSNEIPPTYWGTGSTTSTAQWNTTNAAYGCRDGDLFTQGVVSTQTTVASDNYTYITGDLTVADLTKNILGLVANNAVIVWNPSSSPTQSILTDSQRNINAAILSVAHSFTVQNFASGSVRGTLAITGSIAQNFRGKIQSGAHSYTGSYTYDPLLASVTPPKFLAPANTTFSISRYASVGAAFTADGSSTQ